MTSFLLYIFHAGVALTVFFAIYELFLKKETYFQLNRIYLVSGLLLAFLIPALPVTSPFAAPAALPALDVSATPSAAARAFGPAGLLSILYWAGAFIFLLRFGLQLLRLRRIVRRNGIRLVRGVKVVEVDHDFPPFSFLDIVFVGEGFSHDPSFRRILAHEEVHIRQQHTFDVLLMEIVLSLQWFNPLVWPYKKALQATHEYLADSGVIAQGFSPVKYQLLVFEQHLGASLFEPGNNFKRSQIKRRIMMLSKAKSPNAAKLKLLLALPLALALVLAFAEPKTAASPAGPVVGQEKSGKTADDQAIAQKQHVQEELKRLVTMEKELRAKLESAPNDEARAEIKNKLKTVIEKRKEMEAAVANPGIGKPFPASIEELEDELAKLQAKEKDVREKLKVTTEPQRQAKLEETLKKITQIQETYKNALEKAKANKAAKSSKAAK